MTVRAVGWGFRHAGRRRWALRGLNLNMADGERVLLAGPSGAGKSTLLTALAGLLDQDHSGEQEGRLAAAAPAALMFQDPDTQLVMARAGDDVAFGLENLAIPGDEIWPRVDEALELAGFPYHRDHPVSRLSGGEKQRLVLAGVLALRPRLLLLDEPTANLDPEGSAQVRKAVRNVLDQTRASLILVEHRVSDWLDLVDRVVVLEPGGGVAADGPPDRLFAPKRSGDLARIGVWVPGHAGTPPLSASASSPDLPGEPEPVAGRRAGRRATGPVRLVARDLSYRYRNAVRFAVAGAEVELRAGQTLAITGPNGSGKSTLALLLAGLLPPTAGAVHPPGRPRPPLHRRRARDLVRTVGSVFQDPEHQFLTGSVTEELALGPRQVGLSPTAVRRQVEELLGRLHLDHLTDANPFTLSGGEKRRLSVATALATQPDVLILDEPTFGQDPRTWYGLLDLLTKLHHEGHAICCVSHDQPFVDRVADQELRMADGRLSG